MMMRFALCMLINVASALQLGHAAALQLGRCSSACAAALPRTAAASMNENLQLAGTSAEGAEMWDEAWGTDAFADMELKGVWERTGKGKKRWSPGDTTGDIVVDASLLYSMWIMNRPDLHARDACPKCSTVRFVLGHLNFPFDLKLSDRDLTADAADSPAMQKFKELDVDGNGYLEGKELEALAAWVWGDFGPAGITLNAAQTSSMVETLMRKVDDNSDGRLSPAEFKDYFGSDEAQLPMLDGQGVPGSVPGSAGAEGLVGALPICSFATASTSKGSVPVATGRADVQEWVAQAEAGTAQLDELAAMLTGLHAPDQSPCLNPWGFTIDDALVLPHLRNLKPTEGELEEWPAVVRAYLEMSCERCGVPLIA